MVFMPEIYHLGESCLQKPQFLRLEGVLHKMKYKPLLCAIFLSLTIDFQSKPLTQAQENLHRYDCNMIPDCYIRDIIV